MGMNARVYKHSGQVGPAAYIVPVIGIIGAIILSFAYAYINVYSPIAGYISILFVGGFAFGTGSVVSLAGNLGKCRNKLFMTISGFLISIFALYTSWVVFLFALSKRFSESALDINLVDMFFSPRWIWNMISLLSKDGWYSIGSSGGNVSGTLLWIFWGVEALAVIVVVTFVSSSFVSSSVFCEKCSKWCTEPEPVNLTIPSEEVMQQLINGDTGKLESLEPIRPSVSDYLKVELYGCDKCRDTAGLRLSMVAESTNKKGEIEEDILPLTEVFVVPYYQVEKLKNLSPLNVVSDDKKDGEDKDKENSLS
ncbi:MAG: hypothetical protein GY757_54690 [bacterium]|nr:hypothetical protein [bacterium]